MDLALRHLAVLCALEDEGSVGRAAARLGLSQPALSAQLKRIEGHLGCAVFDRTPTGVVVTRPGRRVLSDARAVLGEMDRFRRSHLSTRTESDVLRVGGHGPLLVQLAGALGQLPGPPPVTVRTQKSSRLLELELERRALDFVVVREYAPVPVPRSPGVAQALLVEREPLFVGLSAAHPLAALDTVALADLADQPWALDADDDSGENEMLTQACRAAGFAPQLGLLGDDNGVARSWVGGGRAVALFEARARQDHELVVRPLHGDPVHCRLSLRWLADRRLEPPPDEVHRLLVEVYVTALQEHPVYRRWWGSHGPRDGAVTEQLAAREGAGHEPGGGVRASTSTAETR